MEEKPQIRNIYVTEEVAKRIIPKGCYCYDQNGLCPFWDMMDDKPRHENGYCHYLEEGDFTPNGTFLLWDQCKECGINDDDDSLYIEEDFSI